MMAACSSCGTVQRSATCQLPRKVTSLPTTALRRARSACGRRWGEGDDHIARDQRGGDYRDPWGGPIRATYGQRQCIQHRCQCGIGEKGEHLILFFSKDHSFQTQIRRSHRPCSTGSRRLASNYPHSSVRTAIFTPVPVQTDNRSRPHTRTLNGL